jgi:DNA-binding NarL/FixJ family response regulator
MAKSIKTHLLCYDDHRGFSEEVKRHFADSEWCTVSTFHTRQDFIGYLEKVEKNKFCKIALLGMLENKEQFNMIDKLTMEIKRIDPQTGIILLGSPGRMEEIKKAVKFNIDAYIPKNANSILRIHNTAKKLKKEHSIAILRRQRNLSLYIFLSFLLLSLLLLLYFYFKFPSFF